ncbi:MAG TPA: glycosyltransferase family 9 protein, partial [Hanamia sp.]|nr:glycosyltransferase family 9 protein [Hanamia sp.]
ELKFKQFYNKIFKPTGPISVVTNLKFLIIRFSSIGDIVLTTPVIRCLRKKYPDAAIHYLTKKKFADILRSNPYLDKVILLDDNLKNTIEEIEREKYDHIIDLHHNLRTLRIKNSIREIPFHSFHKLNIKKWIYTNFKINLMPHKHIVDRYMATVEKLGVVNDGLGLDYFIPENEQIKKDDIPFSHSQGYVAIAIGAAHNTKKLPVEKLKDLVEKIKYPIILLGGKEDFMNGEKIAESDTVKIYNACGKFSLNESADIVQNAKLVISHDTGLMHIAAAFKKNILSVWGNTVPSFGMVPYQTMCEIFQVNKLWCRPCSKTGFDKCPLGHFKCMKNQSMDAIAEKTHSLVKK